MKISMRAWAVIVSAFAGILLAIGPTGARAQSRKGTVAAETLAVYGQMSKEDDPIQTLQHGTAVQVLFSVATGDGNWCSIANADGATKLGYVDCKGLAIETALGGETIASASSAAPPGPPPTRQQKEWALAASAIIATANHEGTTTLAADTPARAREILAAAGAVHSRDDFFKVLNTLDQGPERDQYSWAGARISALSDDQFNKMLSRLNSRQIEEAKAIRDYYPSHQGQSLIGWDYGRYISVCRWGVAAGYITEDEAWPLVMNAARILQRSFVSWQDFGENYLVGRKFIPPIIVGTPYESPQAAYDWVVSSPSSPWQKIPWNLPLN